MSLFDRIWAGAYDALTGKADRAGDVRLRHRLVAPARGRVLEVGAGTGRNLPLYRDADEVVALEPEQHSRAYAERRAPQAPVPVDVVAGDGQDLPFDDASFDTVVTSLVLCTVPELDATLDEVARVLKPGGEVRFWEHVRSDDDDLARWQDRFETPWGWWGRGCHPNRATVDAIRARFTVDEVEAYDASGVPRIVRPHVIGVARKR